MVISGYETDMGHYGPSIKDYETNDLGWKCKDFIWLPRQDQLQEMVKRQTTQMLMSDFWDNPQWKEYLIYEKPYFMIFTSMEQLWLAFVMKERWNKIWEDGKWITEK